MNTARARATSVCQRLLRTSHVKKCAYPMPSQARRISPVLGVTHLLERHKWLTDDEESFWKVRKEFRNCRILSNFIDRDF